MRILRYDDLDIYLGATLLMDYRQTDEEISADVGYPFSKFRPATLAEDVLEMAEKALGDYLKPGKYRRFIDLFARATGLRPRIAALKAHGYAENGVWYFEDRPNQFRRLQNWVNRQDGKYAALLIGSCNPEAMEVTSKRSLVAFADASVPWSGKHDHGETHHFSLIHPQKGEIDDYVIDYELTELEYLAR